MTTEKTLGERINDCMATRSLLKFPVGTATYSRAMHALPGLDGELKELMVAEGLTEARTKSAVATIDEHGVIWVKRWELPL